MGVHVLKRDQILKNVRLDEAWQFFSKPENLKKITPDYMGFDMVSSQERKEMHAGQIIRYVVKPLAGIPMQWTTEITNVDSPCFFVDEQRQGPYKMWHHQHRFTAKGNHVLKEDIVHYQLPFGWLGDLMNRLVVRKKLKEIFDYRSRTIRQVFKSDE